MKNLKPILDFLKPVGWLLLIAFLFFHYQSCENFKKEKASVLHLLNVSKDSITTYKTKQNKLVSEIQAVQLDNEVFKSQAQQVPALQKELKDANVKIDNLTSLSTAYTQTEIDKTIPLKDSNAGIFLIDTGKSTTIYDTLWIKSFSDSNRYYVVKGVVNKKAVELRLHINDSLTLVTGYKTDKFWSKPQFMITAQNTNPYVTIKNLSNYTIVPKQKWYNSTWFKFGSGVVSGIIVEKYLLK